LSKVSNRMECSRMTRGAHLDVVPFSPAIHRKAGHDLELVLSPVLPGGVRGLQVLANALVYVGNARHNAHVHVALLAS
jgi:hypothetical protein